MVYPRYKFCLEIWRRSRCVAWNRELPSQRKGRTGTGKGGKEKERKEQRRKGVIRISLYSSKAGAVGVPESNPLSVQKIKGSTRTSVAELLTFGARKSFLEIHGALSLTSPAFPFFVSNTMQVNQPMCQAYMSSLSFFFLIVLRGNQPRDMSVLNVNTPFLHFPKWIYPSWAALISHMFLRKAPCFMLRSP